MSSGPSRSITAASSPTSAGWRARARGPTLYFAHPYCSCERRANENHNGIIRRFLPKGTDFARVADRTVREIQRWMNAYPRRILDGSTPLERFRQEFGLIPSKCSIMEAG